MREGLDPDVRVDLGQNNMQHYALPAPPPDPRPAVKASLEFLDLAEAEGYDIVILNDSSDELPFDREVRMPAQLQILQQITSRKLLYLNPATDVTDDLIVRMNNAFRAAQTGP